MSTPGLTLDADELREITGKARREAPPQPVVQVAPSRFVTIPLAAAITGLTASAMRTKISRGFWVEGREYVRAPDGHVFVDLRGFERWVAKEAA